MEPEFRVRPEWLLTGAGPETEVEYSDLLDRLSKVGLDQSGPWERIEKLAAALDKNTRAVEGLHGLLERVIITRPEEDHRQNIAEILTELQVGIEEGKALIATKNAVPENQRDDLSTEEILAEIRRLLTVEPPPRQKRILEVVAEGRAESGESRASSSQPPRKRRRAR